MLPDIPRTLCQKRKDQPNILQLDNATFHKAKRLRLPDNVLLLFQPPNSPEFNPAENVWWKIKSVATNMAFPSPHELSEFLPKQVKSPTRETIMSICRFEYYQSAKHIWPIL